LTLDRGTAYLGVMIDDLISNGVDEPYRMFTSRAEHRLLLREDNADERLTPLGRAVGLIDDARWARFCAKQERLARGREALDGVVVTPTADWTERLAAAELAPVSRRTALSELLRRPGVALADVQRLLDPDLPATRALAALTPDEAWALDVSVRFAGYLERERADVARLRKQAALSLPRHLPYADIPGLSRELATKLAAQRPESLAAAARISGMTPAALALLAIAAQRTAGAAAAEHAEDGAAPTRETRSTT